MPTLISRETFGEFAELRRTLVNGRFPSASPEQPGIAGIFVPWAGDRLIGEGGIYYVGIATRGEFWASDTQDFDTRLGVTEQCVSGREGCETPFWQFLDGLTWALFGAPFDQTKEQWGWSNLLKIGWSEGNPGQRLRDDQRDICAKSLREEFEQLHHSLVVIASSGTQNVLDHPAVFPQLVPRWKASWSDNWHQNYDTQTGIWWFKDVYSGNLYVHNYHPRRMVQAGDSFWGSALGCTIQLARALMPRFA